MDEPCSALDPISTLAVEDLIHELKDQYTIVIVTHNMQQAARVSDKTAFYSLEATGKPGQLIEFNDTTTTSKTLSARKPKTTSQAASANRQSNRESTPVAASAPYGWGARQPGCRCF